MNNDKITVLPDGSAFSVMSTPLPHTHWIYGDTGVPPMPFRMGGDDPRRQEFADRIREAAKYAVKGATMNGRETDFDPDALLQNLIIGMLGYNTPDGLDEDARYNPTPVPAPYPGMEPK